MNIFTGIAKVQLKYTLKDCIDSDNYNASCESTIDCNGKNMVCEETRLQCVCFPGYSYKSSNRSCVAGRLMLDR